MGPAPYTVDQYQMSNMDAARGSKSTYHSDGLGHGHGSAVAGTGASGNRLDGDSISGGGGGLDGSSLITATSARLLITILARFLGGCEKDTIHTAVTVW